MARSPTWRAGRSIALLVFEAWGLAGCSAVATTASRDADGIPRSAALREWTACAALTQAARSSKADAATQATQCVDRLMARVSSGEGLRVQPGRVRVDRIDIDVELRGRSASLMAPVTLRRAVDIRAGGLGNHRYGRADFGVPVALISATAPIKRPSPTYAVARSGRIPVDVK